jgi:16S rRNA processing protein RimM
VAEATERLELLDAGRRVYVGPRLVTVSWRRGSPDRPVIKLESVDDRDAAESLRGSAITVPREDLGPLGEGEYWIDDLIGCEVSAGRARIGSVRDVLMLPSVEALAVDREDGELLVPLVDGAVESIDLEAGRIDVNLDFLEGK